MSQLELTIKFFKLFKPLEKLIFIEHHGKSLSRKKSKRIKNMQLKRIDVGIRRAIRTRKH